MHLHELLKYMPSVCFVIYQVVVCVFVQVIKVINVELFLFLGIIHSHIYSDTGIMCVLIPAAL